MGSGASRSRRSSPGWFRSCSSCGSCAAPACPSLSEWHPAGCEALLEQLESEKQRRFELEMQLQEAQHARAQAEAHSEQLVRSLEASSREMSSMVAANKSSRLGVESKFEREKERHISSYEFSLQDERRQVLGMERAVGAERQGRLACEHELDCERAARLNAESLLLNEQNAHDATSAALQAERHAKAAAEQREAEAVLEASHLEARLEELRRVLEELRNRGNHDGALAEMTAKMHAAINFAIMAVNQCDASAEQWQQMCLDAARHAANLLVHCDSAGGTARAAVAADEQQLVLIRVCAAGSPVSPRWSAGAVESLHISLGALAQVVHL